MVWFAGDDFIWALILVVIAVILILVLFKFGLKQRAFEEEQLEKHFNRR